MSFFKAYDMRGTYGVDFDLALIERIGEELPAVIRRCNERIGQPSGATLRIAVGRDGRATSPEIARALIAGLTAAGATVEDLGIVTTPTVYWTTAAEDFDGSVMVTASHNPTGDNGLKVSMRTALPVGYANGLDEVERAVTSRFPKRLAGYVDFLRKQLPTEGFAPLRFAVDCSSGTAALLARELFPTAEIINGTVDGDFHAHSPNPLKAEAREQLAALIRERGYDCGVIFDGDADRAMFLDERGEFIQPDYLTPIIAAVTQTAIARAGEEIPSPPIVLHDVRTSRGAVEFLRENGFKPIAIPVGHAFAKPLMRQHQAICGGELAGHYYFRDFFGCDSGFLAAIRVLTSVAAAKRDGKTFSQLMAPIMSRYRNSGELNFTVADKPAAIARVLAVAEKAAPVVERLEIDGVRLEYADGWMNIRASNTEPLLRLLVEAKTDAELQRRIKLFSEAICS